MGFSEIGLVAAFGLVVVMICATASQLSLREPRQAAATTLILLICLFTAVGRLTLG